MVLGLIWASYYSMKGLSNTKIFFNLIQYFLRLACYLGLYYTNEKYQELFAQPKVTLTVTLLNKWFCQLLARTRQ